MNLALRGADGARKYLMVDDVDRVHRPEVGDRNSRRTLASEVERAVAVPFVMGRLVASRRSHP
ncbi:hypothetical protein, partial [Streptomyces echinatus]|uniref:hypothetical protein n=1 Tax=Streptomyces echinatus TaxID=67293 RepID=UPI0031EFCB08